MNRSLGILRTQHDNIKMDQRKEAVRMRRTDPPQDHVQWELWYKRCLRALLTESNLVKYPTDQRN
jgi:hypothetical protein